MLTICILYGSLFYQDQVFYESYRYEMLVIAGRGPHILVGDDAVLLHVNEPGQRGTVVLKGSRWATS